MTKEQKQQHARVSPQPVPPPQNPSSPALISAAPGPRLGYPSPKCSQTAWRISSSSGDAAGRCPSRGAAASDSPRRTDVSLSRPPVSPAASEGAGASASGSAARPAFEGATSALPCLAGSSLESSSGAGPGDACHIRDRKRLPMLLSRRTQPCIGVVCEVKEDEVRHALEVVRKMMAVIFFPRPVAWIIFFSFFPFLFFSPSSLPRGRGAARQGVVFLTGSHPRAMFATSL